ncbi:hypothetical protein LZ198_16300 [Myxococcus sp. K15C18031901]|uniref:hypothetical protein n=1 Tax=Myxococcus dinghuensis TaxID=2906761 RepID=UPI0020A6F0E7|nr:hypothetical protein [Myxococcus dinghuensis]MCP3100432.1 hypothetical protein [Myxococcus dinghuensis]
MLVASSDVARQTGLKPWALSLPFGANQDGSELVLKFLEHAEVSGARFVTDLQVVFSTEEEGQPLECRTPLTPEGPGAGARASWGHMASATGTSFVALQRVHRPFSDVQLTCKEDAPLVMVSLGQRRYEHDEYPPLRVDSFHVRQPTRWCASAPVTRYRSLYRFEDAVGFTPPRAELIRQARPGLRLVRSGAECVLLAPDAPRGNRIEAIAYGGQGPDAALLKGLDDVAMPSVDL